MRVVLAALNAKYMHSSLALASLAAAAKDQGHEIIICEFTINQPHQDILSSLFALNPDLLGFSCYIWNAAAVMQLCQDYKKIARHCSIILGGPEVSYDSEKLMQERPYIDYLLQGEGEEVWHALLKALHLKEQPPSTPGLSWRRAGDLRISGELAVINDLDGLSRPDYKSLAGLKDRIIYYESSRGCPFNCSYCLSATIPGVRYRSLGLVQDDLSLLLDEEIRELKFVDRTFNSDEARARAIMEFLLHHPGNTRFHFEIRAELLTDRFIDYLTNVPDNRFFFEIGVQTTCPEALAAVNRPGSWPRAQRMIKRVREETAVHLHLDLIAGLPGEDLERFKITFDDVMALRPHVMQLGFLKLLKGSPLQDAAFQYGAVFQEHPPYRILGNDCISYAGLAILEEIEEMVERFHNSGAFSRTIRYISQEVYNNRHFSLYQELAQFWRRKGLFYRAHKRESEYSYLLDFTGRFSEREKELSREFLKLDCLCLQGPGRLPRGLISRNPEMAREMLYRLIKDEEFVRRHLPDLKPLSPGERRRRVHLEYLMIDPLTEQYLDRENAVLFVYPPGSQQASQVILLNIATTFA